MLKVRARMYQPDVARWGSLDPIDSDTNRFVYSKNNPISLNDPSGLEPCCEVFDFAVEFSKEIAVFRIKSTQDIRAVYSLKIGAEFIERGNRPYKCHCCEYRQCVSDKAYTQICAKPNGRMKPIQFGKWSVVTDIQLSEDASTAQGRTIRFGYRSDQHYPNDVYYTAANSNVGDPEGCHYYAVDRPLVSLTAQLWATLKRNREVLHFKRNLRFLHLVFDECRGKTINPCSAHTVPLEVARKETIVDDDFYLDPDSTPPAIRFP